MAAKNPYSKQRPKNDPYEIWENEEGWTWRVLKKYHASDSAPNARWFCFVTSPYEPDGELGDVYAAEVRDSGATCVYKDFNVTPTKGGPRRNPMSYELQRDLFALQDDTTSITSYIEREEFDKALKTCSDIEETIQSLKFHLRKLK